jgi:hypothetical protein
MVDVVVHDEHSGSSCSVHRLAERLKMVGAPTGESSRNLPAPDREETRCRSTGVARSGAVPSVGRLRAGPDRLGCLTPMGCLATDRLSTMGIVVMGAAVS